MTKNSRLVYEKLDNVNLKDKRKYIENTKILWMPISVGQDYHEFDKLLESIKLINKNFTSITLIKVIVVDLAQKYHLAIQKNKTPDEMIGYAKIRGRVWSENYAHEIKKRFKKIVVEFNTWDQWIGHENYEQARQQIDILYKEKEYFKALLENDVAEFERRHFNREQRNFNDTEKEYCRECIKEECAALIVWNKDIVSPNYSCIFYPKKIPSAMLHVKHNFTNFMSMFAEFSSKSKRVQVLPFNLFRKTSLNFERNSPDFNYRKFSL